MTESMITLPLAMADLALSQDEVRAAKLKALDAEAQLQLMHAVGGGNGEGQVGVTLTVEAGQGLARWLAGRAPLYEQSSAVELKGRAASLRRVVAAIRVALPPLGT
jgi:hypothetical protein